jgi:hypothetical protein
MSEEKYAGEHEAGFEGVDNVPVVQPEVIRVKVQQQAGIDDQSALALQSEYATHYRKIEQLLQGAAVINNPENPIHQKMARETRLALKNVRCDVERTRKFLKDSSLKRGKAIDGYANVLRYLCEPAEERMAAIEQHAERMETARIARLIEDRSRLLAEVGADPSAYNLGVMDESTFVIILDTAKKQKAEKEAAAKRAEEERIAKEQAEAAERERVRAENERLKKVLAEKEAAIARERQIAAANAAKLAEAARAERERAEAAFLAEREAAAAKDREIQERNRKVQEEAAAALRAAEESKRKAEAEAKAAREKEEARLRFERMQAEAKVRQEREAAAAAARMPDKNKLLTLAASIANIQLPAMTSPEGKSTADEVKAWLDDVSVKITRRANML